MPTDALRLGRGAQPLAGGLPRTSRSALHPWPHSTPRHRQGSAMHRLPRTGFHHSLPAAWFAFRCLAYVLTNPVRNRLKEHP